MVEAFDGIFEDGTVGRGQPPGPGVVFQKAFPDADLNRSARRLFAYIDRLLQAVRAPEYVLLTTVELDCEPGRFPDLLVTYFSDRDWDYERRYFIGSVCKPEADASYRHGRLTVELEAGQMARLLAFNGGIRWGAALRIGGVQVPAAKVATAIQESPFESAGAAVLQGIARMGWAARRDLDGLAMWACSQDERLTTILSELPTA